MADEKPQETGNTTIILQSGEKGAIAVFRKKRHLMLTNMLGGIAWGFGTVIGATIFVALLVLLLNWLGGIPYIGQVVHDITNSIQSAELSN